MGSLGAVKPFQSHSASVASESASSAQDHASLRSLADHHSNRGCARPRRLNPGIIQSSPSGVWQHIGTGTGSGRTSASYPSGDAPCKSWTVRLLSDGRPMNGGLERSPLRSPQPPRRSADLSQSTLAYWNLRCGFAGPYRSKESSRRPFIQGWEMRMRTGGGCDRPPSLQADDQLHRMPRCRRGLRRGAGFISALRSNRFAAIAASWFPSAR